MNLDSLGLLGFSTRLSPQPTIPVKPAQILAVWEIRDHKKDVHCRVALLHQDLENEDSDM